MSTGEPLLITTMVRRLTAATFLIIVSSAADRSSDFRSLSSPSGELT
jgi:hypothetical protein